MKPYGLNSEKSIYRFYQKLLAFRKDNPVIIHGRTMEYDHANKNIIAYSRTYENLRVFVFANFSNRTKDYTLPEDIRINAVLLSNYPNISSDGNTVHLSPYQAVVIQSDLPQN